MCLEIGSNFGSFLFHTLLLVILFRGPRLLLLFSQKHLHVGTRQEDGQVFKVAFAELFSEQTVITSLLLCLGTNKKLLEEREMLIELFVNDFILFGLELLDFLIFLRGPRTVWFREPNRSKTVGEFVQALLCLFDIVQFLFELNNHLIVIPNGVLPWQIKVVSLFPAELGNNVA